MPPQKAPDFIRVSPLADAAGWVDVDPGTRRHKQFANVFALGDAASTPNAKTAAAARKQAPVVAHNLLAMRGVGQGDAQYDGYGSCPLTVERGKIVLAEFTYGGKLAPSFPKWLAWALDWQARGMKIVGAIPQGLPPFTLPSWDLALWRELAIPALLISVVGFVESVSVGQTLAAKRRQRISPDQELVALGASNLGAAFTGGFPVTGGFARSVVNFDAGAQTPAVGVLTAAGMLLTTLVLTPALYYLPQATLAATIIVAVLSLVDFGIFKRTWAYSKPDFAAVAATLLATLGLGMETGLLVGVGVSLALYLWRTSRPHIATVGLLPGTESFRNVLRYSVRTSPALLSLRVDERLYFANARSLEDHVNNAVAVQPALRHVVLQCSAINAIDASALESLEAIEHRLREAGITLHLSEVKGPVMDRLRRTDFLHDLRGQVFLTHYQAVAALAPEVVRGTSPHPLTQGPEHTQRAQYRP